MSADSPRRVTRKGSAGHVVLPQPVSDPSLIDSVTGFINEVVPQYTSGAGDSRGQITWARVQQADINDPALYPDTGEQDGVPPLLIVLGYGSGVQVWMVGVSGEAREVLSWSQGSVRSLVVLPSPETRARQDLYRHKRPLVAMVDNAGPGPQFCSVSFISLRDGDQVKSIKFSHQVWEVVASRRCVAVTLSERIAVFDAATLEDSLVVTTCYPSPDINPIALGSRWLAYADRRLVSRWKSAGGCHAEGPHSVTATVFHAAKCLGKGLRDLGGTVASSLTGTSPDHSHSHTNAHVMAAAAAECLKGVVTVLDIESKLPKDAGEDDQSNASRIVAHFNAHSEPIVALAFDPSGLLLASADKRGHRFHVFRINPHASGPTLAHIQHLYVLHRGDTTARIQDIAFSEDSRWVAVSSMRGTTHVFPITPYGGTVGVRTHTTPHVVNKLSRFHRSAGLTDEGRSSPVLWEGSPTPPPVSCQPTASVPTTVTALAQVRRQSALAPPTEESIIRVAACFGAPRAPGLMPLGPARPRRCTDSLFVMACSGTLIQYDLEPRPLSGVTKEKICDDTGVELHVTVRGEWLLQRPPYSSALHPPLPCTNPLLTQPDPPTPTEAMPEDERWLSQVEIVTHAGPHRRLWMGPQFTFITVSSNNEAGETLDITKQMVRSSPVNMPLKQALVIESGSGSCSSLELSPSMVELVYKTDCSWSCRLREDLAEAMQETSTRALDTGCGVLGEVRREPVVERQVNPTGSVVTLTARLDSPVDLEPLMATVVGTETKTITLESRASKPAADASVDLVVISSKVQKNCDYNTKNGKKVLAEADENMSTNTQRKSEEKEPAVETPEKRGKNGKARRKISKGEKNKVKSEVDKKVEEVLVATVDVSGLGMTSTPDEIPLPVYEGLQSSVDIEMQLREASAEPEDSRGRKRSLETTVEHKTNCILLETALTPSQHQEQSNTDDLKENDKANSRQRKKSRNDKEGWANKNVAEERGAEEKVCEPENECEINSAPEKVAKPEEKTKNKKKRSKKSAGLNEIPSEETQFIRKDEKSFEMKKTDDSDIETLLLEVSQETICPETPFLSSEFKVEYYEKQREDTILEVATTIKSTDEVLGSVSIENEIAEINLFEDKSVTTDDELKGFESDLLVKDSGWSPEKSPEHVEIDILMEDKDSDKEIDKIKNDETTDKDSSDDCQPVVVKNDIKSVQKRGKNRKLRKNRELEFKITDNESRREESELKTNVTEVEVFLVNEDKDLADSVLEEANKEIKKLYSEEEELFIEVKKIGIEEESFPEIKLSTDGIKRRIRKRDSTEKEEKIIQPELDPPKRSWSSIVASVGEDPNGNVTKSEEPIVPVRSWSSIAAGTAKSKSQETDITKTNSVEDRDSVYESCNDSVGEEAEPSVSLDSLTSCYYEPEPQTDYIKDEAIASSESKNGSSVEDKSNTDSGEKDDLIIGVQTATKKSKKQKKKKR